MKPFGAAINACSKGSRWSQACFLLQLAEARQLTLGPIVVNTVMGACSRCQQWQQSLHLLGCSRAPDLTTFNTAIASCARAASWQHAIAILDDIPSRQLARDTFSFNSAMGGLGGSRWILGIALLELMALQRVASDAVTYNSLMDAAPQKAQELFRQMLCAEAACLQ